MCVGGGGGWGYMCVGGGATCVLGVGLHVCWGWGTCVFGGREVHKRVGEGLPHMATSD